MARSTASHAAVPDAPIAGVSDRPVFLNLLLSLRPGQARVLTTFYGILGPDGSFMYTNAGYNAPILVSRSGVRRLETGGCVLGLFEQVVFEEETLTLSPGDFIVAFSDGVTEAMNSGSEELGDERLLMCVENHRAGGRRWR